MFSNPSIPVKLLNVGDYVWSSNFNSGGMIEKLDRFHSPIISYLIHFDDGSKAFDTSPIACKFKPSELVWVSAMGSYVDLIVNKAVSCDVFSLTDSRINSTIEECINNILSNSEYLALTQTPTNALNSSSITATVSKFELFDSAIISTNGNYYDCMICAIWSGTCGITYDVFIGVLGIQSNVLEKDLFTIKEFSNFQTTGRHLSRNTLASAYANKQLNDFKPTFESPKSRNPCTCGAHAVAGRHSTWCDIKN